MTQFQENVTVVAVLKVVFKGADVAVFEGAVDLDFGLQLSRSRGVKVGKEVGEKKDETKTTNQLKTLYYLLEHTFCRARALTRLLLGTTLTA